jgi:hypothetical protein
MKPKHDNGKPDTRYTVTVEHDGHVTPRHVARFLGERIDAATNRRDAWAICTQHQRERLEIHDMAAAVFK